MEAANFKSMEYGMPLVCGGLKDYEKMKEEYEAEYGEDYSYGMYEADLYDEFAYANELAETFSRSLMFHKVTVESGYYCGFQFVVEEIHSDYFDLDKDSEYCIDNEDAHYYFDMCRSKALRQADIEKRKIEKWLESLESKGFSILVCTAHFSNGETSYAYRTPRTQLIAAARA